MHTSQIFWYFLEKATDHKQHTNLDSIGFQQNIVTIKHHTLWLQLSQLRTILD